MFSPPNSRSGEKSTTPEGREGGINRLVTGLKTGWAACFHDSQKATPRPKKTALPPVDQSISRSVDRVHRTACSPQAQLYGALCSRDTRQGTKTTNSTTFAPRLLVVYSQPHRGALASRSRRRVDDQPMPSCAAQRRAWDRDRIWDRDRDRGPRPASRHESTSKGKGGRIVRSPPPPPPSMAGSASPRFLLLVVVVIVFLNIF